MVRTLVSAVAIRGCFFFSLLNRVKNFVLGVFVIAFVQCELKEVKQTTKFSLLSNSTQSDYVVMF